MQIKRFEAPTMTEALRLIKKEFGPDAVILSARSLNQGKGLFGVKKQTWIEVTAAIDSIKEETTNQMIETKSVAAAAGRTSGPLKGQKVSIRIDDSITDLGLFHNTPMDVRPARNPYSPSFPEMDEHFKEKFIRHFSHQGVDHHVVQELLALYIRKYGTETEWGGRHFYANLINVFSEMGISAQSSEGSGRQQIYGFFGPAGSGKTSAMVRLSAIYSYQFKKKVGWITFDTKRVAAAAQLQVYGKILGVPIETVNTIKEFKSSLKHFESMDYIFVDTPGIGIRDARVVQELSEIIEYVRMDQGYLVASASTKNEDLIQMVDVYQPLGVTGLIITKLDESQSYGNILNLLMHSKLPVSYFTNGQEIPKSLEKASTEKLVELLLNPVGESIPSNVPPGKMAEIIPYKNITSRFREHYVANQNAILFHRPECAWVKRIKPENRIAFESVEDALSKQYIPCKTCCNHVPDDRQEINETEVHRVGNGQPYYAR